MRAAWRHRGDVALAGIVCTVGAVVGWGSGDLAWELALGLGAIGMALMMAAAWLMEER